MGLRKNKHAETCQCAVCERTRPKATYISFDDDFYHLTVSLGSSFLLPSCVIIAPYLADAAAS